MLLWWGMGCIGAARCPASPPSADITVAADGTGDFTTVQKAIDAVPSNSDRVTVIFIKRGVYDTEKLIVPADKKNVTLVGESREETLISYHTYNCNEGICPVADASKWTGETIRTAATLTVLGSGFRAENLTIRNTAGPVGQAQALTLRADKAVFINCDITGYQDTLYFWSAGIRCYFRNCLVAGRTDYIYGDGIAVFDSCEIKSWGGGWITAPSTPKSQAYGFVFIKCKVTYADNSPRAGDDGTKFRFGRPWHEYPKVAWLYCDITGMLNPEGWGDTWSMSYASTSSDLHLFEYGNTGPGADMKGRAAWAGLRALTGEEALQYTVQKVLAGSDNWDPTVQPPMVQQYNWSGQGADNDWLTAGNWTPAGIPAGGEVATVAGPAGISSRGLFSADLFLLDSVQMEVKGSASAAYLSAKGIHLLANGADTLSGKIAVKDSLVAEINGQLLLRAGLSGIHKLVKKGPGRLILTADNSSFSGKTEVWSGTLEARSANSLGKGSTEVRSGAKLVAGNNNAFNAKARLTVATDASLELTSPVTTSEFVIGNVIQPVGEYSSVTHPGLISGTGSVIVGRPSLFQFIGGANNNWDNPAHYSPALLPEAGETVISEKQMETTSWVFPADIVFRGAGHLRLRGNHKATGSITLEKGTAFTYNTGGAGMALNAAIRAEGDADMIMESANASGSTMKLEGPVSGGATITALNNGRGTVNTGTLVLSGDNSNFTGTWSLTRYSAKYPAVQGYHTFLEGVSEHAFGPSTIDAALKSRVIISHPKAAWPRLTLHLKDSARLILNVAATVREYILNGQPVPPGVYSASTHPQWYGGSGTLTVEPETGLNNRQQTLPVTVLADEIRIRGNDSRVVLYNVAGQVMGIHQNAQTISLQGLPPGIFVIRYLVDGYSGYLKLRR